jgi:ABC-type nitrate/sulfonate/bicarbonate transport system substrate-binding protein
LRAGHLHDEFSRDPAIDLRSVLDSSDSEIHDAHFYGTLPNAFRLGGNIPPIWARSRGASTRVIGISWTTTPAPVLTLPDSGIRTSADLKGKRLLIIGHPGEEIDFFYAGALRTYEVALASAGLTLRDVTLVEKSVGGSSEHSAPRQKGAEVRRLVPGYDKNAILPLLSRDVDAIVSQGAAAINLIDSFGLHVVYDTSQDPDPVLRTHNSVPKLLTVDGRLVDEQPEIVTRILARLLDVPSWAEANPQEAIHFLALEQSVADDLIEATSGKNFAQELELNLLDVNLARLAAQKAFLLKHGIIEKDFDLDQWIDPQPLEAARRLVAERRQNGTASEPSAGKAFRAGPAGCVIRPAEAR